MKAALEQKDKKLRAPNLDLYLEKAWGGGI